MCDLKAIEELQAGIMRFTHRLKPYRDMSAIEQMTEELCNALYLRLEHLKRCEDPKYNACEEKAERLQLGELFHALGALSDTGVLAQVLSKENQAKLQGILGGLKEESLIEAGLRKKDLAGFLRNSGDTDILIDKHSAIEEAAKKKDR